MADLKRIQNLDPLRGFLALMVVFNHIAMLSRSADLPNLSQFAICNRGPEAVFVFFSLSGYLIIGLLFEEKKKLGTINIKSFYIRRILRLYPVYYLVLFMGLFHYQIVLPALNIPFKINYNTAEALLLNVGLLPNVFKALYNPGSILSILWSIGIEEQFYLAVAPILYIIPLKKHFKYLLLFSIVYFLLYHTNMFSFLRQYYLLYFYMSTGGLLAILVKLGYRVHFSSWSLRIIMYIIFIVHFFSNLFQFSTIFWQNLFQLILFNLVIVNLANESKFNITNPFINHLGKISYGIYMYHMFAIHIIVFVFMKLHNEILPKWATILTINLFSLAGTLMVSHISYKYYELKFLRLKGIFRPKSQYNTQ
ncbi:acyltransferase [Mangrovimonas sp. TPBH4]|uniref:acyltransferase family protein n=1 Tax=Mangrovimonas sp. TPBH4 TaxID=1645914 RepID=UPI0012F75546|nr:acyltransferase [Mangrovimonas sp. TPBH4]